jgi:hypothetical protein
MLKITHTAYPNGKVIEHFYSIDEDRLRELTNKMRLENKAKKGGVNFCELSALEQVKRQLKIVSRKLA